MSQKNWQDKLFEATRLGDINRVKKCIENGADVDFCDEDKDTPLVIAAVAGDVDIIQYLLNSDADIDKVSERSGETPLCSACRCGHLEVVKFLTDNYAKLEATNAFQDTPLACAAWYGQKEVIQYLLTLNIDINYGGHEGKTALHVAAQQEYQQECLEVAKLLVNAGADINKADKNLENPLQSALVRNNLSIVKFLMERGSKVPVLNEQLQSKVLNDLMESLKIIESLLQQTNYDKDASCLSDTFKNGSLSIIKYLVEIGVDKKTALSNAALAGRDDVVDYLLSKGCDVNSIDSEGNTPLSNAAKSENLDAVTPLVELGADVCKTGHNGRTPLSVAVELQNFHIVKYLIENGATPTMQTAFLEAIEVGNFRIVRYMKEKGALVNFKYDNGQTPLAKAVEAGHVRIAKYLHQNGTNADIDDQKHFFLMKYVCEKNFDMVEFLVELGVDVSSVGDCGYTPLTKAVELENFQMVKYFVEKGVDVNCIDKEERTALGIAAANGYFSIVKFLIESGANVELAKAEIDAYKGRNENVAVMLRLLGTNEVKKENGTGQEEDEV